MPIPNNDAVALRRRQAKLGMTLSLGALVASGILSRLNGPWQQGARVLHVCSGAALIGFSYWHVTLYQNNAHMKGRKA